MIKKQSYIVFILLLLVTFLMTQTCVAATGSISGTVSGDTDRVRPLAGVTVEVYSVRSGALVGSAVSSTLGGDYSIGGLENGSYVVRTKNQLGYIDEFYDDQPCLSKACEGVTPTTVTIILGRSVTGVDFVLNQYGAISGTVTVWDVLTVPAGSHVLVYDAAGNYVKTSTALDATGYYEVTGLIDGDYFARTETSDHFEDVLYGGGACPNGFCDVTSGTPISVSHGVITSGVDFDIWSCPTVDGIISSADGYLEGVEVRLYKVLGFVLLQLVDVTLTDANGAYSLGGVRTQVAVVTSNSAGYIDEIYDEAHDDHVCPGTTCTATLTSTFDLGPFGPGFGVDADFELVKGGSISGTITDAATGDPIEEVSVFVHGSIFSDEKPVASAITDASGAYTVRGLPAYRFYRGVTHNTLGWVDEMFDGLVCVEGYCDALGGEYITVETGVDTPSIDFALDRGGRISGIITDEVTGAPIADAQIDIDDLSDSPDGGDLPTLNVFSDAAGFYISPTLPPGKYTARTVQLESKGYADEIWKDTWCDSDSCDLYTGTPIVVAPDAETTGIDFSLLFGAIEGAITDAITGLPVPGVFVRAYSDSGPFLGFGVSEQSDELGKYRILGLPVGEFRLATSFTSEVAENYLGEVYDDLLCFPNSCKNVAIESPQAKGVKVVGGLTTAGINFDLSRGGEISGASVHATTGDPVSARFSAYDTSGTSVATAFGVGEYSIGPLAAGTYTVRADVSDSAYDWVYDNQKCDPDCDAVTQTPVTVTSGNETPGIDFVFDLGGKISGLIQHVDGRLFYDHTDTLYVTVHDQYGEIVSTAYPEFYINTWEWPLIWQTPELPAGTYFARLHDDWRGGIETFQGQAYASIPCEPDCDVTQAAPITVEWGLTTAGIGFVVEDEIGIAARISPDEAQGSVLLFDDSGVQVASCEMHMLDLQYPPHGCLLRGLAPGTYYARTETSSHIDQLYDGQLCADGTCDVTAGTPIIFDPDSSPNHMTIYFTLEAEPTHYSVGGTVTGLEGTGLILRNNGGDDLEISINGGFNFPTLLVDGSSYDVTVLTQPDGPSQTCSVTNGSGTLTGSNVNDVVVSCAVKSDLIFKSGFEDSPAN